MASAEKFIVSLYKTPQAKDDAEDAFEDTLGYINISDLLANDSGGEAKEFYGFYDESDPTAALQSIQSGLGAELTVNADGTITYNATLAFESSIQSLAAGETAEDWFEYVIRLSDGTLSKATVYVTVTGENDAIAVTAEDLAGAVTEDAADPALTDSGTIGFGDDDLSDVHTVSSVVLKSTTHTAQLGALTAFVSTDTAGIGTGGVVSWDFTVDNGAVQFLGLGDTIAETYSVSFTDGQGSAVTRDIVVTMTGANDAASITVTAGGDYAVTEAGGTAGDPSASGDLDVSDVDDGEATFATPASLAGAYGSFTFDASTGAWAYTLDETLADGLTGGEVVTDTLTVSSLDGTASHDIVVTVTGTDDEPPAPALFTETADVVNFGNFASGAAPVTAGSYQDGTQYAALGGDDVVYLPETAADASAAGYDPTRTFDAGSGDDIVWGGQLADIIEGGEGADGIRGRDGDDTIRGDAGDDTVRGGAGNDLVDGGDGRDTLFFLGAATGVTLDTVAGTATGEGTDSLANFERYFLTNFDDDVSGSAAAEEFRLYDGTDVIDAGAGNDIIRIGNGNKTIDGGEGLVDTLSFFEADYGVEVDLFAGTATGAGVTTLSGIENVSGTACDDTITGDAGINALYGYDGDDTIFGGAERDSITGGRGNDVLTGGADTDTFVYIPSQGPEGDDLITDFTVGVDAIRFFGSGFTTLADLNPTQVGSDTVLDLGGGDSITLQGVQAADLSDDSFVF